MTATQPTTTQKRNKLFDGSKNRNGLSKLLMDICIIPIKEKIINDKIKKSFDDYQKLKLIISETASELNIDIEKIKGKDRKNNHVTARQIIVFIVRYTTDLSLRQIAKEISIYSPKHHASIINNTKKAFYFIHTPDEDFLSIFNRIKQRLDAHYGISFDLDSHEKMPEWYRKLIKNN